MKRLSIYLTAFATAAVVLAPSLLLAQAEGHGHETLREAVTAGEPAPTHEAGPVTPFAGTIAQSIAALLVFAIVFIVLRAKAWGPILKGLTDRESKIRGDLEAAEAARTEAANSLASYKQQIANADAEVRTKLATAQKDAEAIGARLKMDAQKDIDEMKSRATREIEETKNAALVEVRQQAAVLSTAIAGKILKRNINEADQADLIRSSLEELQSSGRR